MRPRDDWLANKVGDAVVGQDMPARHTRSSNQATALRITVVAVSPVVVVCLDVGDAGVVVDEGVQVPGPDQRCRHVTLCCPVRGRGRGTIPAALLAADILPPAMAGRRGVALSGVKRSARYLRRPAQGSIGPRRMPFEPLR